MLATNPDLRLRPGMSQDIDFLGFLLERRKPSVVTDAAGFAAMRTEWESLHDASDASVFLSWGWLYPWYSRLGRGRNLRIITLRDHRGELEGLLPLCVEERPLVGTRLGPTVRRMAFLGETLVGSDYLDVIARKDDRERITRRLLQATRDSVDWDALDLNDMDSQSPTIDLIRELFGGPDYTLEWRDGPACPYEQFRPRDTFDTFAKGLARNETYKRRRKWLEKQEGYRVLRATRPHEMDSALAEFFRLHDLRWREDGGSDGITCPAVEAFHGEATGYLAERGHVCLYTMMVGDRAVASFYALMHSGKMICYLTGRDPEWQSRSVGTVLVGETFRDAFEMGMREYDFLRGEEPYKADWASRQRHLTSVRIYRTGTKGALLAMRERALRSARQAVRKALPTGLVSKLRRLTV